MTYDVSTRALGAYLQKLTHTYVNDLRKISQKKTSSGKKLACLATGSYSINSVYNEVDHTPLSRGPHTLPYPRLCANSHQIQNWFVRGML